MAGGQRRRQLCTADKSASGVNHRSDWKVVGWKSQFAMSCVCECVFDCFVLLMSFDITFIKQRTSRFKFTVFTTHVKSHPEERRERNTVHRSDSMYHGWRMSADRGCRKYRLLTHPKLLFVFCFCFFVGGDSDCCEKHVERPI